MANPTDRFLNAYNLIDKALHELTDQDRYVGFNRVVDLGARKNAVVQQYADDLRSLSRLRNVIVHEQGTGFMATPNEQAVAVMERVAQLLSDPPKVYPLFKTDVFSLAVHDPLAKAVAAMYERGFTQVPLYEKDRFSWLLTTNTIARWLGSRAKKGPVNLQETALEELMPFQRSRENVRFLARDTPLPEAIELIGQLDNKKRRLDALLITHSGKPDQGLLGIITHYDLPRAYEVINGD